MESWKKYSKILILIRKKNKIKRAALILISDFDFGDIAQKMCQMTNLTFEQAGSSNLLLRGKIWHIFWGNVTKVKIPSEIILPLV